MSLKVYLADLTHMGSGVATEAFPLNIGLIASYAIKRLGKDVEISVFKYPDDLQQAFRSATPHVLGCSNYTWNSNLSYHFLRWAKALNPDILTVWGGTNYPFSEEKQRQFMLARPALDVHTHYEGEEGFANLLERRLSVSTRDGVFSAPIEGCRFIDKPSGDLISGPSLPRMIELDCIPSPYATGLLDRFFDGKLTPLLETARGCPFRCNFCNAGDVYFTKMNLFSDEYVRDEFTYVARKASEAGIGHMTLADNNFGMIPRDAKTAELVHELKEKYDWPRSLTVWTGKNSKERVIDATRLLGDTLSVSMSVQAMDPEVLKNIERDNIKLDHYKAISQELNEQGRPQHAELIVPLPGETFESYLRSVGELLDTNVGSVTIHTLQMLHGPPYRDDAEFIERWGYGNSKYRIVPLDFGLYDGTPVFDTEPVSVDTAHMSFEDYVESRKLTLVIDMSYNGNVFRPLRQYLMSKGIPHSAWVMELYSRLDEFPAAIKAIFDSFEQETRDELWDSEDELIRHYSNPQNYEKLLTGEAGGNVLYRHKVRLFAQEAQTWLDSVFGFTEDVVERYSGKSVMEELAELRRFIWCTLVDSFEFSAREPSIGETFNYDLLRWLERSDAPPLEEFRVRVPVRLHFYFDDDQLAMRKDAMVRYGPSLTGMVKLVQRVGGHHRLVRKITHAVPDAMVSNS